MKYWTNFSILPRLSYGTPRKEPRLTQSSTLSTAVVTLRRVKVGSVVRGEKGTRDCTRVLEMIQYTGWICSVQSRNLHNLEIALRILRIPKLRANLEIAHWGFTQS